MKKINRFLKLKLMDTQQYRISKFVSKKKDEFDVFEYGLISQPKPYSKTLDVVFLTNQEVEVLRKVFKKMRLWRNQ